jgi:heme-degrading monooxygenase HmoA
MLVRTWRGYTAPINGQAYPRHLLESVRPKLEGLAGFKGIYLLRRQVGDEIEFLVITIWESMDAVRAFAGDQPEIAVIEPAARAALTRFDSTVSHYEVLAGPGYTG